MPPPLVFRFFFSVVNNEVERGGGKDGGTVWDTKGGGGICSEGVTSLDPIVWRDASGAVSGVGSGNEGAGAGGGGDDGREEKEGEKENATPWGTDGPPCNFGKENGFSVDVGGEKEDGRRCGRVGLCMWESTEGDTSMVFPPPSRFVPSGCRYIPFPTRATGKRSASSPPPPPPSVVPSVRGGGGGTPLPPLLLGLLSSGCSTTTPCRGVSLSPSLSSFFSAPSHSVVCGVPCKECKRF